MGEDVGRYGGSYAVSKGLLEEFGPERIRDTPLSESAFVGAGIGAALGGMRPIVEIMTVNFSLLALDQILNTAATLLHMSGGQFNVPLVIRMATGAGRQLAAQHSHSLEGWYAHIPGLQVLAPATLEDARGMLWPALRIPIPVLIFEHAALYTVEGELAGRRRRGRHRSRGGAPPGRDVTLITYGGTLGQDARRRRRRSRREGIEAEVSTCARCARSTTRRSSSRSRGRTARVIVDEGWRSGQLSRRDRARDHGAARSTSSTRRSRACAAPRCRCPMPQHLEDAALPQAERDRRPPRATLVTAPMAEFRMPSLGADMDAGTLLEWRKRRATACSAATSSRWSTREKAEIEVEILEAGVVEDCSCSAGEKVPGRHAARPAARRRRRDASPRRRRRAAVAPAPPVAAARRAPEPRRLRRTAAAARRPAGEPRARVRRCVARGVAARARRRSRDVAGTGPGRRDHPRRRRARGARAARAAGATRGRASAPAPAAAPRDRRERRCARAIAAAMARSKREIPHYYLAHEIDLQRALALARASERERARSPSACCPRRCFVKAVALAPRRSARAERLLARRRVPARRGQSTSASRSRCAAAGWSRRRSTTPTR